MGSDHQRQLSFYKSAAEMGLPAQHQYRRVDRPPTAAADQHRSTMALSALCQLTRKTWPRSTRYRLRGRSTSTATRYPSILSPDDLTAAWLDSSGHIYVSGDPIGGEARWPSSRRPTPRPEITTSTTITAKVWWPVGSARTLFWKTTSSTITTTPICTSEFNHQPLVRGNLIHCTNDPAFMRRASIHYTTAPGIQVRDELLPQETIPPLSSGQIIINNIVIGCSNISAYPPASGRRIKWRVGSQQHVRQARAASRPTASTISCSTMARHTPTQFPSITSSPKYARRDPARNREPTPISATFTVAHTRTTSPRGLVVCRRWSRGRQPKTGRPDANPAFQRRGT